jgi:uncharacterized protein (TIGR03382 family)
MMKRALLAMTTLCALATAAEARDFRLSQIPNNPAECLTCHARFGGSARDAFGEDVEANLVGDPISSADVDWTAIFDLDSDGDGFTNGEELGDPNGTWTPAMPSPPGPFYDPGDADDLPECGNDVIDDVNDEACDGVDLGNATCASEGFTGGSLACTETCTLDTSSCTNGPSPDGGVPDAAPDGGAPDAGAPDTGSSDAGGGAPDAATGAPDAGTGSNDGSESESDDEGCQAVGGGTLLTWGLLLAVPWIRGRRRGLRAERRHSSDTASGQLGGSASLNP